MIAGPCGAESEELIKISIDEAKAKKIDFLRVNLWKPRTKPGFEGMQYNGLKLMVMAAKAGINPGTEVMLPEHAKAVIEKLLPVIKNGKLLIWIGARNQNHFIQREIGKIAGSDKRIVLMLKNQVWHNEKHWEGIIEHTLSSGISEDQLILCHRGFTPSGDNPHGYRNMPDYDMAIRIKERYKLPMIFDPSHTGGSVEKVFQIAKEADLHGFDGYMIEVHPNPKIAQSDSNQQLTWKQYKELMRTLYDQRVEMAKKHKVLI